MQTGLSLRLPGAECVGLDEATAAGLTVTKLDEAGAVETLLVVNPLGSPVACLVA
jgi:hypothetical protein